MNHFEPRKILSDHQLLKEGLLSERQSIEREINNIYEQIKSSAQNHNFKAIQASLTEIEKLKDILGHYEAKYRGIVSLETLCDDPKTYDIATDTNFSVDDIPF